MSNALSQLREKVVSDLTVLIETYGQVDRYGRDIRGGRVLPPMGKVPARLVWKEHWNRWGSEDSGFAEWCDSGFTLELRPDLYRRLERASTSEELTSAILKIGRSLGSFSSLCERLEFLRE
jgi:hypothetical protein